VKVAAINLGCPKNCVDLEYILGSLNSSIEIIQEISRADVAVVNTCAFIQPAIEESLETIFEISKFKKYNLKKLIVTGCLPQRFGEKIQAELPEVDLLLFDREIQTISNKLSDYLEIESAKTHWQYYQTTPGHYAYVKIAEGCDNCCTYCTIPKIKGIFQSIEPDKIISQTRTLIEKEAKEIILVAQDSTNYGKDLSGTHTIVTLLKRILKLKDLHWLRLMYSHPAHFTDELVELLASEQNLCSYVDIPIQHVSNRILSAMGRKIDKDSLHVLFDKLRATIPDVAIRSTVLVGFPGETEKEFIELLDFLSEVKFERLGVFTYWRERGTRAYDLPGQISTVEKNNRQSEVLDLQADISATNNKKLINRQLEVVIDSYNQDTKKSIGRTQWDFPDIDNEIILDTQATPGQFYHATITGSDGFDLFGTLI